MGVKVRLSVGDRSMANSQALRQGNLQVCEEVVPEPSQVDGALDPCRGGPPRRSNFIPGHEGA